MDNNEIDDLLDGVLDEVQDEVQDEVTPEDETLRDAKKFLSLMEEFDVKEGSNMEANLQKNKKEIIESKIKINDEKELEELTISIIESNELLEDFILVRETLREDIKATRVVLSKLSEDLTNMCAEDMNGQVVLAFSDMKKSNVKSMELLINSYEKVAQTQLSVKKLTQELKTEENKQRQLEASEDGGGTNIQNAIFVGSPSELLERLKN
jgi:D-mannonate dehydratase